jgi:hypothetical protein
MKTVRLSDGKYEFDLDDGQMVDARRYGEHWAAGYESRFNHAFVAALLRIAELEEANEPEKADGQVAHHVDAIVALLAARGDEDASETRAWLAGLPATARHRLNEADRAALQRADAAYTAGRFVPQAEMGLRIALLGLEREVAPKFAYSKTLESIVAHVRAAADYIQARRLHVAPPPPESMDWKAEATRLRALLDTPETADFIRGVELEKAHQEDRWGTDDRRAKAPTDWFWLVGYLAGKALAAHLSGNLEKARHHTISTAAALAHWHASTVQPGSPRAAAVDDSQNPGPRP